MRYKARPFEIEAVEWKGTNLPEVKEFTANDVGFNCRIEGDNDLWVWDFLQNCWVHANIGDFIIRGSKGEFYPCDPEVFHNKYEAIDEPEPASLRFISIAEAKEILGLE